MYVSKAFVVVAIIFSIYFGSLIFITQNQNYWSFIFLKNALLILDILFIRIIKDYAE